MNVSSSLAFVALPISPVYCATKAGLHSFTESLRVQLKNTKVKVFEVAPPVTQTELLGGFDVEDMKGASTMKVEEMVQVAVKGMQTNRFEIRPGQANQLPIETDLNPATGDWSVPQKAATALNRYGHVNDIAAMVAFVAGPEASYITGANLTVDGGMNA